MTKRLLAAALMIIGGKLKTAGDWCNRKALKLFGFNIPAAPPPFEHPHEVLPMAGGCMDCGSMFAVETEFKAHKCPVRA